jgi:signal transduction histidine kinase
VAAGGRRGYDPPAVARILHIEDDPKNRLLVRKLLEAAGHEVFDAEGGLEGIRLAADHPPDLILVDLYLPDLDGYEVTLRLRGMPALEGVPIVAITAEGDREISLAVGADGFLEKPIDAGRFGRQIERFLKGHKERGKTRASQQLRIAGQRIVERLERKVVELSEANAQLEEAMRLRREFLRNLSHELATPMTPIVGYLRLLLGEELGPINPMQEKSLRAVQDSTERLRGLIDTLLDVSSLETGRMHFYDRRYDFGRVAARALEQAQRRLNERDLEIHIEPAPAGLHAQGDPDKLRRAMVHVLDNAAKFSRSGGQVAVSIERSGEADDVAYELRVADDGPGVEGEQLSKVFDPFYQVDGSVTRQHGGVGLGLAFARRVTEAMGGGIAIHSPPRHEIAGCSLGGTEVILRVKAQPPPRGPER